MAAVNPAPPAEPTVTPIIGKTYPHDADGNRLDDRIDLKIKQAENLMKMALTSDERQKAKTARGQTLSVELVFREQITQKQIAAFLALGGQNRLYL